MHIETTEVMELLQALREADRYVQHGELWSAATQTFAKGGDTASLVKLLARARGLLGDGVGSLAEAKERGRADGLANKAMIENPFGIQTPQGIAWSEGYMETENERLVKLGAEHYRYGYERESCPFVLGSRWGKGWLEGWHAERAKTLPEPITQAREFGRKDFLNGSEICPYVEGTPRAIYWQQGYDEAKAAASVKS